MRTLAHSRSTSRSSRLLGVAAAVLAAAALAPAAHATSFTWTPATAGTYDFTTPANWSPNTNYPGDGIGASDIAAISIATSPGGAIVINDAGLPATLGSLTLATSGTSTTSDSLTFNINGTTNIAGVLSATSTAANAPIFLNLNANTTVGGTLSASVNTSVSISNNAVVAVTGTASFLGSLSLANGTLTTTGITTTSTGVYNVGANGRVAVTGNIANSNQNLTLNLNDPSAFFTATGNFGGTSSGSGVGGLTVNGSGNFTLSGTYNTSTGNTAGAATFNTSGTVTIGTFNYGRTQSGDAATTGAGTGLHILQGNLNITNLQLGTANSNVTGDITGGTLTVSNEFSIGRNNSTRRNVFAVNGGAVVSTEPTRGIVIGQSQVAGGASSGWLEITAGSVTAERIQVGGSNFGTLTGGATSNRGVLEMVGGNLYLGSGGIVGVATSGGTGITPSAYTINLAGGTLGAKADWSSSASMNLNGAVTFQAADAGNTARNIALSGALLGTGSIAKTGDGTVTLSGPNTFSGGINVNAGKLLANASSGSAFGTGAVTVASNATLGGVGNDSSVGAINIQSGATLAPGIPGLLGGVGILNTNALTLDNNAILSLDLTSSPAANDTVHIQGGNAFVMNGSVLVNMFDGGTNSPFAYNGDYHIITGIDSTQGGNNFNVANFIWNNPGGGLSVTFSLENTTGTLQDVVMHIAGGIGLSSWTGAVGTDWATAGNWSGGIPNSSGATASFGAAATSYTVALNGTRTLGTMAINSGSNSGYTFTGGLLTLNNGASAASLGVAGGNNLIASNVELASNTMISTTAAGQTLTITGVISSAAAKGLTVSGPGLLVLAGNNTYGGATLIDATGKVQLGNGGAAGSFGTGPVTNDGGILLNFGSPATVASAISGAGSLSQTGAGKVTLTGLNTYTGPTSIAAGSALAVDYTAGGLAANTAVTNNGTLTLQGGPSGGAQTLSTGITLGDNARLNVIGGSGDTMAATIAGGTYGNNVTVNVDASTAAASLALGTPSLSTANTFTFIVGGAAGGTLTMGNSTLNPGVTLNVNAGGTAVLTAGTTTFNSGAVVTVGGGASTATLTATASVINGSPIAINANGVANLGNSSFNGTTAAIAVNGGTLNLGNTNYVGRTELSGDAASTINLGALTRGSLGALNVTSAGALTTTHADGFVGGWATLNGQDFAQVTTGVVAPSTSVDNAWSGDNVSVISSNAVAAGSTANSLRFKTAGSQTVTLGGVATLSSGAILVSSNVGANNATITGGTLQANTGQEIILNQRNTAGNLVINSAIAGNGGTPALTKLGPGKVVLSGPVTTAGTTNVIEGTLQLGSSIAYAPGINNAWNVASTSAGIDLNGFNATITGLSGAGTITNSSGTPSTFTLANTAAITHTGVIAGNISLVKTGAGTVTVRNSQTFTGNLDVSNGLVLADFQNAGAISTNLLPNTATLTLHNAGNVQVSSRSNATVGQQFANTFLADGSSTVSQGTRQSNGHFYLALGTISRNFGTTLDFSGPSTLSSSTTDGNTGIFATNGDFTTGFVGGWATSGSGWAVNNFSASAVDGNQGHIYAMAAASYSNSLGSGTNTDMTASLTAGGPDNVTNSVRFNTAAPTTLDFTGGTNTVDSGGIMVTSTVGANASIIQGGNLTAGAGNELFIHQNNSSSGLTIASNIINPAGGTLTVTKAGIGTVTLTGASNYGGTTYINAGQVAFAGGTTHNVGALRGTSAAIASGTTVAIAPNSGTSKLNALSIAGSTGNWSGKLNITNNVLAIQSADTASKATALATLVDQVTSGKNGGSWNGNGITSSSNIGNPAATLTVSDNADLGWTSSGGQALDSNSIVVTRALIGDVNLDGNVDLADYDRWYKHVGTGTPFSFAAGDVNMDGNIDLADYDLWYKNVGAAPLTLTSQSALGGGVSAVPEPASLAVLALGSAALLGTRRRRK